MNLLSYSLLLKLRQRKEKVRGKKSFRKDLVQFSYSEVRKVKCLIKETTLNGNIVKFYQGILFL